MRSPLDFGNSEFFRADLVGRNLQPYKKSPYKVSYPINYETVLDFKSVIDSPDKLIDEPIFANQLYVRNQFGANGGYKLVLDVNRLNNTKTNNGEYNNSKQRIPKDNTKKRIENLQYNLFLDVDTIIDSGDYFNKDEFLFDPARGNKNILHYWLPGANGGKPYFQAETYTAAEILLNNSQTKSKIAKDSYIIKLSSTYLNEYFIERKGRFILKYTEALKFRNLYTNIADPFELYNLLPTIQPFWNITAPSNLLIGLTRLGFDTVGGELPFTPIIGSYFDESISLNGKPNKTIIGSIFSQRKTGNQLFLNNTGEGQKSILFLNLKYNRYSPSYKKGNEDGFLIKGKNNYYVGSNDNEPSDIESPYDDLPTDEFGRKTHNIVYGSDLLSKSYEGEDFNPKIGLNGTSTIDGGGIEGGLTWVSPKYRSNAGLNVGQGGDVTGGSYGSTPPTFDSSESTGFEFKEGSIMDDTQRLINAQPNGANRLKHVGNAIDQVSKVFNDGYKEITKGSRIKRYEYQNPTTFTNGTFQEYCRLFTKDSPYMSYNRLQKKNGIRTEGRRLEGSVFNKTYDLSIHPKKGEETKKYMLSLENLAWRTSGNFVNLPECEKGLNGGRLMWFPPYDLKFTDTSTANWNENTFLGRPESVYTYKSTTRSGSIGFSIIVDHPSVLNIITNKILATENRSEEINGIINSFIAGCLTYDLYDLAKVYTTIGLDELQELQKTIIETVETTQEEMTYIERTVVTGVDPFTILETKEPVNEQLNILDGYKGYAFYFDNDIPKGSEVYQTLFSNYTGNTSYSTVPALKTFMDDIVKDNFEQLNKFIEAANLLEDTDKLEITLTSSASSPATNQYNNSLSERRTNSVVKYLTENIKFKGLNIIFYNRGENITELITKSSKSGVSPTTVPNCSNLGSDVDKIKSVQAMACRRTVISDIKLTRKGKPPEPVTPPQPITPITKDVKLIKETTTIKQNELLEKVQGKNISKKVLQRLLTECDYFEAIKETDPFVYENLKSKLKYFTPSFHSTTPEGLNSRLTFLQQCVRPGDTIPTINKNNELTFKDSKNTSFGIPPVLILRVGDFYHTKIIPETLTFGYENLDINPEGIGLQPMIVKVELSFKFVGGHGLTSAIDRLQNALSYNFYANTEVYEQRSDVTDRSLDKMDTDLYNFYKAKDNPIINPIDNPVQYTNSFYKPIGVVSGDAINYKDFLTELINQTNEYINSIKSLNEDFILDNNFNLLKYFTWNKYSLSYEGEIVEGTDVKLFGIPDLSYIKRITNYFDDAIKNIDNNNDNFIEDLKLKDNRLFVPDKKTVNVIKLNYINFFNKRRDGVLSNLNSYSNKLIDIQLKYLSFLNKAGLILSEYDGGNGYDGYIDKNGNIFAYRLTGNTINVKTIVNTVGFKLNDFYTKLINEFDYESNLKLDEIFLSLDNSKQTSLVYAFLYGYINKPEFYDVFFDEIMTKDLLKTISTQQDKDFITGIFNNYWKGEIVKYDKYSSVIGRGGKDMLTFLRDKNIFNYLNNLTGNDYSVKAVKIRDINNNVENAFKNIVYGTEKMDKTKWSIFKNSLIYVKNKIER
jgi:outer membrane protein OmpA-like peptidoglycan-associated protein